MKTSVLVAALALAALSGLAQDTAAARAAYQQQQALAEVPRLVQQFDLLVQNQDAIVARLVKLEGTDATGGATPGREYTSCRRRKIPACRGCRRR